MSVSSHDLNSLNLDSLKVPPLHQLTNESAYYKDNETVKNNYIVNTNSFNQFIESVNE